jgi:hypothetical protein
VYVGNVLLNFKDSSFIVYLSVYVGNVLLNFKASSFIVYIYLCMLIDKQQKLLALKLRSTLPTYTGR